VPQDAPMVSTFEAPLGAGHIRVQLIRADLPLEALCGFAERYDAGRGYSVVSKVLGKNFPARPRFMDEVHRRLAAKLPANLPGPILFVALAETAVGLGAAVYQSYRAQGRQDTWFVHTSRYQVGPALIFQETHSHAPRHFVHLPSQPDAQAAWAQARSLVLIDDEVTTGRTFLNLAGVLAPHVPKLTQIFGACLTAWLPSDAPLWAQMPQNTTLVSLLEGQCSYDGPPRPGSAERHASPNVVLGPASQGRLGSQILPTYPEKWLAQLPPLAPGAKILVLGSGEFIYPPYLFARALEAGGHQVWLQSTTRSPLHPGGMIRAKLTFPDNYQEGITNYLYNVDPDDYDLILLAYERLEGPSPLLDLLAPKLVVLA